MPIVKLTFIPSVIVTDQNGYGGSPNILIYSNDQSGRYAFPFLTPKIKEIYYNIFSSYPIIDLEYTPEAVIIKTRISNTSQLDDLKNQVNYRIDGTSAWGDLDLDEESLIYSGLDDITGIGNFLYVPLLEEMEIVRT